MGAGSDLPTWVCVGHESPETQVRIDLEGLGVPVDVTLNHVMVELRPFRIAIAVNENDVDPHSVRDQQTSLVLRESRDSNRVLGRVSLRFGDVITHSPYSFLLFETLRATNQCLPWLQVQSHYLYERCKRLVDRDPRNVHRMTTADLFSCWLLYSLPRKVALVSFYDNDRGNMFPMDLIGVTDSPYYLMSLTSKDPALPLIVASRKLAVSDVPVGYASIVYGLAKNHHRESIDFSELPFETGRSRQFGIPVPNDALSVREVYIERCHEVDHHTVFITTTRNIESRRAGLQLYHVQRVYQQYLAVHGRPLPTADRGF